MPPNTKAFLYYYLSPEKPCIAGELRLRVTSSDDPASFENGSDLLRYNGRPWSRPLHVLPELYIPLYEKLREEQLVPDDLDRVLSALPKENFRYSWSHLYTLNDEFIVDFGIWGMELFVITEQGAERLRLLELFSDRRKRSKAIFYRAYTGGYANHPISTLLYWLQYFHEFVGSALARFERSTNPDHKGTRTVVLRFLKIITPVKCVVPNYDGRICCPREGELYRRTKNNTESEWSVDIDKFNSIMTRCFRLLWDA